MIGFEAFRGPRPKNLVYQTDHGRLLNGRAEAILKSSFARTYSGRIQLILTSPPFPLNRKKAYGNQTGAEYIQWLAQFGPLFRDLLTQDGSLVVEVGNAWESGRPAMSTLPLESLLELKRAGKFELCQEFIWFNPAKLPTPAQWVNVERIRVKDAYTRFWWLAKDDRPKANNRSVLLTYSESMDLLLKTQRYNAGRRPSEHVIGAESFLTDNGGAIPPNVIVESNTSSADPYLTLCKEMGIHPHPARMPTSIPSFFIKFLTDPGDLVLDPFAGSNTTGAAAEALDRRWFSFEVNEVYARSSIGRFAQREIPFASRTVEAHGRGQ
jgi:DNA modification methylase